MQKATRNALASYIDHLKKANDTDTVAAPFAVSELEAARIINLQKESIDLLSRINLIPSRDEEGTAGAFVSGTLASRTNTELGPRKPRELQVDPIEYKCLKTEFDAAVTYATLDSLAASFPDFLQALDKELAVIRGLDQITIGWNGLEAAEETDRVEFPLLQDVNTGWLERVRKAAPDRVRSSATIGAAGDFASLDALVYGLIQGLDECHRKRKDLVVIIDRDLLHTKMLESVAAGASSIEAEAALTRILTTGKIAGLDIYDSPSFPSGTVAVTSLKNLSIYYQAPSVRRFLVDEPDLNRIVDYFSQNEVYIVEQYGLISFAEGVSFLAPAGEGQ